MPTKYDKTFPQYSAEMSFESCKVLEDIIHGRKSNHPSNAVKSKKFCKMCPVCTGTCENSDRSVILIYGFRNSKKNEKLSQTIFDTSCQNERRL